MKLIHRNSTLIALIGFFALWSCGPSNKPQENAGDFDTTKGISKVIDDVLYDIPSPSEIPYLLQATGAEFNQGLLNNRKKVDSYMARSDKAALNLGVYTTDIGYLSSYDKTQEAIDYLNAAKALADNLGIIGSFGVDMLSKFEANISKKDSLAILIDQAAKDADKYLRDDDRNKLAAMIITGSFIEGLYISTGLIKSYPKDLLPDDQRNLVLTPLIRVILEQEKSVGDLVKMLSNLDQSEPIAGIVTDLNSLSATYRALNINEKIKNNKANLVLTDKNLEEITKIVAKLRTSITD